MPERDGYIAGVPCWVDTSQPDPDAAARFYEGLFGWEFEDVMPPEAPGRYLTARIRGGDVAAASSPPEGVPPHAVWNTYIWVDSADETATKVLDAGGTIVTAPFDVMDAGRMAVCADPEGAVFSIWQAGRHKGARIINEHGAVNFNGLHTHDVDAAERFYGDVFGWGILSLGGGGEFWTLSAYGDHLERERPGLREQTVAFGAPAEFADVVANIVRIPKDEPERSAHWDVTFAVDDADAAADKAADLGGRVLVAPVDVPWARLTVIEDPQGAAFIASKFVAENRNLANPEHVPAGAA